MLSEALRFRMRIQFGPLGAKGELKPKAFWSASNGNDGTDRTCRPIELIRRSLANVASLTSRQSIPGCADALLRHLYRFQAFNVRTGNVGSLRPTARNTMVMRPCVLSPNRGSVAA